MMSQLSPTLEGFRAAFRRPSLTFAEIAWRWSIWATGAALLGFAFFEYVASLPVTGIEERLLKARQPLLALQVLSRILRTTVDRAMAATLMVAVALVLAWLIAASVGRAATVQALLEYFRSNASFSSSEQRDRATTFRPLITINFWRVTATLAALLSLGAVLILSKLISRRKHAGSELAFLFIVLFPPLIWAAWVLLNWVLSLACVFVLRNGEDALAAISAAVTFLRDRTGAVLAVGTWNLLAHIAVLGGALTLVSILSAFAPIVPARALAGGTLLVMLAYFAFVDWLYMARLAGYICIAETPNADISLAMPDVQIPPGGSPTIQSSNPLATAVDPNEPILSDVPDTDFEE
jgi:hypothetical protein